MTEAESNEKTTISVVYCKPGERAETVEMEEKLENVIIYAKSLGLSLDECIEIFKSIYEEV